MSTIIHGQGVGLVLSGGGASGFAHIGVLKALEENGIPITYVTGTSAGALVGSMYACGYSPTEIEAYVTSEKFLLMTSGGLLKTQEFLLREDDPNSSTISFSFSADSIFKKSLPTNFIRPELLDFEMLLLFGRTSAARKQNFDSLFVPFRCVGSDIVAKKGVVFDHGNLNEAVRASMTFPFYVNPIRINGVLYFDGGLYNNFPSDILYQSFSPDYIIGSNVSYNAKPPQEDDLISQLTNMLVTYTNFNIPCQEGIIIEPKTSVETFDFEEVQTAINAGYSATIAKIDSIKAQVKERISVEELAQKRAAFRALIPAIKISEVNTLNKVGLDVSYVRKSILKNNKGKTINQTQLERRYFRTYATPQIQYLYPTLSYRPDSTYSLSVKVTSAKSFRVDVGGLVSSRAINTGFVQLNYLRLGKAAITAQVNSYFGKFYGSGKGNIDIHLPSYYPVSFGVYATINRWDYFRSFATFFEDVKPSFLVQYETYAGAQFKMPVFNNSKVVFDYRHVELEDSYYQTSQFTNKDTTDLTRFSGNSLSLIIEHNSLNRKQFASSGILASLKARYVDGREHSVSGSTAIENYDYKMQHDWINVYGEFHAFPITDKKFAFGIHAIASFTSQSLFKNYTATILSMNSFQPLPDMQTFFQPEYRAPQFIGGGFNIIFSPKKNFDLRFDSYLFQPFKQLVINDDGSFGYSKLFKGETQAAAISGIYHSPLGPVRLSLDYFPRQQNPFILQFSYGYILFNERATRW
jgi:NTE family protein